MLFYKKKEKQNLLEIRAKTEYCRSRLESYLKDLKDNGSATFYAKGSVTRIKNIVDDMKIIEDMFEQMHIKTQ